MLRTTLCLLFLFVSLAVGADPEIVTRAQWGAAKPTSEKPLKIIPPNYVVIHHSAGPVCSTSEKCKTIVKGIQNFHMKNLNWLDIGYNFLIGGDGLVYEGRGWKIYGSHMPGYNSKSIGICLLGNFQEQTPTPKQLQTAKDLISFAVKNGNLTSDYKLIGHRQGIATQCPGNNLYTEIVQWPHWSNQL